MSTRARALLAAVFSGALFLVPAHAADSYMRIPEINGDSQDSQHFGWITLSGVRMGAFAGSPVRGPSAGPATHSISLTRRTDKISAALMNASVHGRRFAAVQIDSYEDNGESRRISLQDVTISSFSTFGITDNFALQFANSSVMGLPSYIPSSRPVLPH